MLTAVKVYGKEMLDEKMVKIIVPPDEQEGAMRYVEFQKEKIIDQKTEGYKNDEQFFLKY